jgi:hypothetical protein
MAEPMTIVGPRPRWALAAATIAILFGVVTIIVGGKTLFGTAEERVAAGHYVAFVLWFNFVAGFVYCAAGAGVLLWRRWAAALAAVIAIATLLVFAAFGAHVWSGGDFEMRTVGAMTLRSALWLAIAIALCRSLGWPARAPV